MFFLYSTIWADRLRQAKKPNKSITQTLHLPGDFNNHNTIWGCKKTHRKYNGTEIFITDKEICLLNLKTPTHINPANENLSAINAIIYVDIIIVRSKLSPLYLVIWHQETKMNLYIILSYIWRSAHTCTILVSIKSWTKQHLLYPDVPTIYQMVSEAKHKHGPFTTANANYLDRQRRRKLYGIRKNDEARPRKMCIFLHVAGKKSVEVYTALTFKEEEKGNFNALVRKSKILSRAKRLNPQTLCLHYQRPEITTTIAILFSHQNWTLVTIRIL